MAARRTCTSCGSPPRPAADRARVPPSQNAARPRPPTHTRPGPGPLRPLRSYLVSDRSTGNAIFLAEEESSCWCRCCCGGGAQPAFVKFFNATYGGMRQPVACCGTECVPEKKMWLKANGDAEQAVLTLEKPGCGTNYANTCVADPPPCSRAADCVRARGLCTARTRLASAACTRHAPPHASLLPQALRQLLRVHGVLPVGGHHPPR